MYVFSLCKDGAMVETFQTSEIFTLNDALNGFVLNLFNNTSAYRALFLSSGRYSILTRSLASAGWAGYNVGIKVYYR